MKSSQRWIALVLMVAAVLTMRPATPTTTPTTASRIADRVYATAVPTLFAQNSQLTLMDRRLIKYVWAVITNAQILALSGNATKAITILPAQGAGTVTEALGGILSFNGVGAYTINGSNKLRLWYTSRATGPAASNAMTTVGFLDQSSAKILTYGGVPTDEIPTPNTPIVLQDTTAVAYTGGNASDTVTVRLAYRVHLQ